MTESFGEELIPNMTTMALGEENGYENVSSYEDGEESGIPTTPIPLSSPKGSSYTTTMAIGEEGIGNNISTSPPPQIQPNPFGSFRTD